MNFDIRSWFVVCLLLAPVPCEAGIFEETLRKAAIHNGFSPADETHRSVENDLVSAGKELFQSRSMSLNANVSCRDCHLDRFGSGDGIPVAIGIGGQGEGLERIEHGGAIIPRNTLPLWGRGGKGFDVLFWDGKVDFHGTTKISQFGENRPSDDPLIVAVHLPAVEIREMLKEDVIVRSNKLEDTSAAKTVYAAIAAHVRNTEPKPVSTIAKFLEVETQDVEFLHMAQAIADFIRDKFRIRETRFHKFVFNNGVLTEKEMRGGLLFYGKGKCSTCHSGPYLSDFAFHSIPFPQLGFGKNGFGIDYGRYNVTLNPADLYKFRTPPLFNVSKTEPYGHSGSVMEIRSAIMFHFDPLGMIDTSVMSRLDRVEFYKKMLASSDGILSIGYLDEQEVDELEEFLRTLAY
jgi:cytochrome c peroxidase